MRRMVRARRSGSRKPEMSMRPGMSRPGMSMRPTAMASPGMTVSSRRERRLSRMVDWRLWLSSCREAPCRRSTGRGWKVARRVSARLRPRSRRRMSWRGKRLRGMRSNQSWARPAPMWRLWLGSQVKRTCWGRVRGLWRRAPGLLSQSFQPKRRDSMSPTHPARDGESRRTRQVGARRKMTLPVATRTRQATRTPQATKTRQATKMGRGSTVWKTRPRRGRSPPPGDRPMSGSALAMPGSTSTEPWIRTAIQGGAKRGRRR